MLRRKQLDFLSFLFQRIPSEQRPRVLADFVPAPRDGAELAATFEVILDVTPRGWTVRAPGAPDRDQRAGRSSKFRASASSAATEVAKESSPWA
jgi:hypothetical protein